MLYRHFSPVRLPAASRILAHLPPVRGKERAAHGQKEAKWLRAGLIRLKNKGQCLDEEIENCWQADTEWLAVAGPARLAVECAFKYSFRQDLQFQRPHGPRFTQLGAAKWSGLASSLHCRFPLFTPNSPAHTDLPRSTDITHSAPVSTFWSTQSGKADSKPKQATRGNCTRHKSQVQGPELTVSRRWAADLAAVQLQSPSNRCHNPTRGSSSARR